MTTVSFPTAADSIRAAIDAGILHAGSWGDGAQAVCMMSAIVKGADSTDDCVSAGWPEWLASLNVSLFDATVGADDEDKDRATFALDLAEAAASPFDPDKARDLFLVRRLVDGDHSALKSLRLNPVDADWWRDCETAILTVADLIRLRAAGEDVTEKMPAARAAARAAADAAARAAARAAAYAAYAAAYAAARAAYAAYAAAYAAARAAARAAADAAADAAARAAAYAAARAAADAAARSDLVESIAEARMTPKGAA